jgi:outer membrane protein assembly factor BamB
MFCRILSHCATFLVIATLASAVADPVVQAQELRDSWPQWRGPQRDGIHRGKSWPESLTPDSLNLLWQVTLGPSYSGPVIVGDRVFTTETKDKKYEVVHALDRKTGQEIWQTSWEGSMNVPFFAAANGSWIRSTPAVDGDRIYVAGMRDVLMCLRTEDGKQLWRFDFVKEFGTPLPAFGFVCSPLVDGDYVYVQAGASLVCLNKMTGAVVWRTLKDNGGMEDSAFSSPILATIGGKRQLLVQGRQKLSGVDPMTGEVLWSQFVPNYRGMNILTPVVWNDSVFTSSYQNKSWLYRISHDNQQFGVAEVWRNNAQGYMSTPVLIDDHVYLFLQNQRFTCIDLKTGERTWTSGNFGKYCSLIGQGDKILALDQRGILLLLRANPKQFELISSVKVSDEETWAHLAVCDDEVYIRGLNTLKVFRWTDPKAQP